MADVSAATPALAPVGPRLTSGASSQAQPVPQESGYVWPWKGVKWNVAFIGFCAYSIAVITYALPIGQAGMVVALIGLLLGGQRIRFPVPLVFFAAYYLFAVLTSPLSPYANYVYMELQNMGRVALIFLVGINVLQEPTRLRFYLFLYLGAFGLYPVRGALFNQFIYHAAELGRIAWNDIFANPNDLAALLLVPLALSAGIIYVERHRIVRLAALAGVALISLIVFMTQSRGAILALGFFGLVVLARQKKRLRMLPAVALTVVAIAMFAPDSVWTRLKNLESATSSGQLREANDEGSAEQRFEIWKVAVTIWQRYPITGVGLGVYPLEHWKVSRNGGETFKRTARGGRDAHSTYLTVLAETGVIGFSMFLGIFISIYAYAMRTRRIIAKSDPDTERQIFFAQTGLMALAVAGIFGSWAHIPFTYISVAIIYCICYVARQKHRERERAARQVARWA